MGLEFPLPACPYMETVAPISLRKSAVTRLNNSSKEGQTSLQENNKPLFKMSSKNTLE
jgi:hypothetical protein